MANSIVYLFKEYMADGSLDLDNDSFKVALFTGAVPAAGTYSTYTAAASGATEVASGSGYTTGGAALESVSWVRSGDTVTFDAANTAWSSATFSATWGYIYDDTHASDVGVAVVDFSGSKSVSAGTFTINWHSSGIFTLT